MTVIFDTNVWISDLALTSNIGSAVRFFLREQNARIGLPEVIRLETEHNLRAKVNEHIDTIRSNHRQLLSVFGKLKELALPAEEEVEALVQGIFGALRVDIHEFPFELDSARGSFLRAVTKSPPSDRSQQFKDGVLWEDCLKILADDDVYLVTADKAFYESRDPNRGLAKALEKDIAEQCHDFRIFPTLAHLLSEINTGDRIESDELLQACQSILGERIQGMLNQNGFALDGDPEVEMDVFITENPEILFTTFAIAFPCSDETGEGREGARLRLEGEGSYNASEQVFFELASRGERLSYVKADGTEEQIQNVVMAVSGLVMGHRTVEHSVRFKL